ncbi:DUF418 domain-containing protein [Janthinobacterium fluminis]|uniref:Heparan-alpha-glucosaminide N-acetyltransferase domain-containing protein n=1 Tax=Janthinobacterium fluminis TaxID=2987524 RepID=A0ABT5K5W5_9BURK|nr:heparan-alpha-glucosaminide N-acetyltransferase domain-containing protein [Janthinobacterium fluminis]MDC8760176.1 heparan-alpha-glucosaminide N-acetyltransferase domain-containing protein [Janthinobacterium fluminis]
MDKRVVGFDLARALAVIGMVIVNFKIVMHAKAEGAPAWLRVFDVIDGRASAIFVILAGVGLSLLSAKARLANDAAQIRADRLMLVKRAAFLFVVGLLYVQVWPADILHFYGAYLIIGAAALTWRSRTLVAAAALMVLGFVVLVSQYNYEQGWNWHTLSYAHFWTPSKFFYNLFFNGFHPIFPWAGFLLLGIALGRLDWQAPGTRARIFAAGLLVAVAAESLVWWGARQTHTGWGIWGFLLSSQSMPPLPLYFVAASGTACAVIAACIAVGERCRGARWLAPLIHTGQIALTLYVAHVVIGMGMLEAFGKLENQSLGFAIGSALLFCFGAVVFSHLWRQRFKLGPLEWLMRRSTG